MAATDGIPLPDIHHDLAVFDRWTSRFLAGLDDTDRTILAPYVTWHHRRRIVGLIELGTLRPFTTRGARQQTRLASQFLAWLRGKGVTLAECRQADIDGWFANGPMTRLHSINFLVWARATRHCPGRLRSPIHKPAMPTGMPHHDRVVLIARLLHDDTVELADRVAGLLVALYAQPVTRLCRIRLDDIDLTNASSSVVVGSARIELDPDTSQLLHRLIEHRAADSVSAWLFPGQHPCRPAAAKTLTERLNRIGVTRDARVAAFHDLAAQIPRPVLAELIGYNPNFLAERTAALGTPWQTYAAVRQHSR